MATKIIGDVELRRKLAQLKDLKSIVPALTAAADHVKGKIAQYPPDANAHRPQPFKTAKSRAFFFWALSKGMIEVPYRRGQSPGSQDHGQKWSVYSNKSGLKQIIGNNTSYGPLLQDPNQQTDYHKKTGWKDTDTVVDEEEETVLKMLKQAVDKILAGR